MATEEQLAAIKVAKVLMVGAGGIGCELLKTLALTVFQNIHIIDMDTIKVSNLNRQFLFRKSHVGQSKAKVAREAVLKFRPDIKITAHHSNVKDPDFNVDFFKQFNIVMNGLDNLDARRHVNRLCLAAGVPLVESGTTRFLGQEVGCFVCSCHLNTHRSKLRDSVERIVTAKLGMNLPLIMLGSSLLYEVGDDLEEDMVVNYSTNLEKVQELTCNITIKHREEFDEEEPDGMILSGRTLASENYKKTSVNNGVSTSGWSQKTPETVEDDDLEIVVAPSHSDVGRTKRKLSDVSKACSSDTKRKPEELNDNYEILGKLEDGNPDAIKKKRAL